MPLRGLTILVAAPDRVRLRSALTLATAQAAHGGTARLFVDAAAVALLLRPVTDPLDAHHAAAGLPTLDALIDEALDAGVRVTLCQTGLALAGATAADVDPRFAFGGMVGLIAELGDDRLVTA